MGSKYLTITTDIGNALIAKAVIDGDKVDITHLAVGDGGGAYYMPDASMTGLVNELWRGGISSAGIDPQDARLIEARAVIPADAPGMVIREMALFDAGGNMVAVGNVAAIEKPDPLSGSSVAISVGMHVLVSDTDAVTVTVDPGVCASAEDVIRIDGVIGKIQGDLSKLEKRVENVENWTGEDIPLKASGAQSVTGAIENVGKRTGEDILIKAGASQSVADAVDAAGKKADDVAKDVEDLKKNPPPSVKVTNSLTSTSTADALSAAMGKKLNDDKLDKTGDASKVKNSFTAAASRVNLATGETLAASLGKVQKWLADLRTVAFTGSYNDLTDKPILNVPLFETDFSRKMPGWIEEGGSFNYTANGIDEPTGGVAGTASVGVGYIGEYPAGKRLRIPVIIPFSSAMMSFSLRFDTTAKGTLAQGVEVSLTGSPAFAFSIGLGDNWGHASASIHVYCCSKQVLHSPGSPTNNGRTYDVNVAFDSGKAYLWLDGARAGADVDMGGQNFTITEIQIVYGGYGSGVYSETGAFGLKNMRIERRLTI